MRNILIGLFFLFSVSVSAQTYNSLPSGFKPYGNQYYKDSVGTILVGTTAGKFRVVAQRQSLDSLAGATLINLSSKVSFYDLADSLTKKERLRAINVLDYGAVPDNSAINNNAAFNRAFIAAQSKGIPAVYIPGGVYRMDSTLIIPNYIKKITGDGSKSTIIDGLQGTVASYSLVNPEVPALVSMTGSDTYLSPIAENIPVQRAFIKSAAGLGLFPGDVIKVIDTAAFSYTSSIESTRAYYKNGQIFTVKRYSNDTIYVHNTVAYPFTANGTTLVYRMNMNQLNMEGIAFRAISTDKARTAAFDHLHKSTLSKVTFYGGGEAGLDLRESYFTNLNNIHVERYALASGTIQLANAYGIKMIGSQNIDIAFSNIYGSRHAIAMSGSANTQNGVVNRYITVLGNNISSIEDLSMDTHGNADNVNISENIIDNGAFLRGGNIKFHHNTLNGAQNVNKGMLYIQEMKNNDFEIKDNALNYNNTANSLMSLMYVEPRIYTDTIGKFIFKNNDIYFRGSPGGTSTWNMVYIHPNEDLIDYPGKFLIDGNETFGTPGRRAVFNFDPASASNKMGYITFTNNKFENVRLSVARAYSLEVSANTFKTAYQHSVSSVGTPNVWMKNNIFNDYVKLNPSGNVISGAGFYISDATNAWVNGNEGLPSSLALYGGSFNNITNLYEGVNRMGKVNNYVGVTNRLGYDFNIGTARMSLGSDATGDIYTRDASGNLSKIADVATGNALISGGVGVAPSYGKVGLTTHVSGTLSVANGGTGATSITGLVKGNGTSVFTAAVAGTDYALPPSNTISSALTFNLSTTGYYKFTGSTTTWTLPSVSTNVGKRFTLINRGSGNITLNSNAGGNDIDESGVFMNTTTIAPVSIMTLYCDGTKWIILD